METVNNRSYIDKMCELNYQFFKAKELIETIPAFIHYNLEGTLQIGIDDLTAEWCDEFYDIPTQLKKVNELIAWDELDYQDEVTSKDVEAALRKSWSKHSKEFAKWWIEMYKDNLLETAIVSYEMNLYEASCVITKGASIGFDMDDRYDKNDPKSRKAWFIKQLAEIRTAWDKYHEDQNKENTQDIDAE